MSKELQAAKDNLAAFKKTLPESRGDYSSEQGFRFVVLCEQVQQLEERDDTTVEIARSFSFKLNVGNFESRDFFCSQKAECKWKDAEAVSEALYTFCKTEVLKSVNEFRTVDAKKIKDVAKDEAFSDAGNKLTTTKNYGMGK